MPDGDNLRKKDLTRDEVNHEKGYNFQENPGLTPGAREPAGENATNRQTEDRRDVNIPKKGTASGF